MPPLFVLRSRSSFFVVIAFRQLGVVESGAKDDAPVAPVVDYTSQGTYTEESACLSCTDARESDTGCCFCACENCFFCEGLHGIYSHPNLSTPTATTSRGGGFSPIRVGQPSTKNVDFAHSVVQVLPLQKVPIAGGGPVRALHRRVGHVRDASLSLSLILATPNLLPLCVW